MNLPCKRIQVDEAWAFCYAKQKNVPTAKAAPEGAGDIWTWVGLDAETKLAASCMSAVAIAKRRWFSWTIWRKRLANRVQLTSDGHKAYLEAVEGAFGADIDYAHAGQGVRTGAGKRQGPLQPGRMHSARSRHRVEGNPDPKHFQYVVCRSGRNLTIRMGNRRMTRLTNAFSKKAENHAHMMAIYFMHYNFVRIHQTLKITPAMAAGVTISFGKCLIW